MLTTVLRFVYRLASGAWLGVIIGVALLTAPIVFTQLPVQTAGSVMGKVFGGYYLVGTALSLLGIGALVWLCQRTGWDLWRGLCAGLLVVPLLFCLYTRFAVMPELLQVRADVWTAVEAQGEEPPALRKRLDQLHHRSVMLNQIMLLAALLLLGLEAVRESRRERGV